MLVSDFLVPDKEAVMVMRQIDDRHDVVHVHVVHVVLVDVVAVAVRIVVGL